MCAYVRAFVCTFVHAFGCECASKEGHILFVSVPILFVISIKALD